MSEPGPFPYMHGYVWDNYQEAKKAREQWMKSWTGGDPMNSHEYVRLRLSEEVALGMFVSHRHEQIAAQYVKNAYAQRQNVGKAYGRASRKIRELRDRLQARAQFQREAIRNCTCGAWRRTHHELFDLTEGS